MRKLKMIIPYILIVIFTPIYLILDKMFFVKIFGCGCVPIAQTNMFNIPFNANNLKFWVFFIFSIIMLLLQLHFTKNIDNKAIRIVLCVTTFILNIIIAFWVYNATMWQ